MIRFEQVTLVYPDAAQPTLRDVDLTIPAGELCVVIGATGSGKSTLLGAINGLVPHFTGGTLRGRVTVDGRDTRTHPPRELADVVGVVTQDPLAGCVTDTLEEELAYGMEQLAIAPAVMRKRVEETLDLLGLAELRHRALRELSAGQLQRVAIGAVLTAHPKVLVLDEPTSALDPTAAEEVLATITRLVHDLGVTVVIAEHRLERVVQYADIIVHLPGDGTVEFGEPDRVLEHSTVAPPIVELGRLARWKPLPLSVRDARRRAAPLTAELADIAAPPAVPQPNTARLEVLRGRGLVVRYGTVAAVRNVDLELFAGEVVALMGRNGAGKSSLLWALQGSGPRDGGRVDVAGHDPADVGPGAARRLVSLVPHTPSDLLYLDTVGDELARADAESTTATGRTRAALDRLAPGILDDTHPRDLSEGQRLALVVAVQLAAAPRVVLLDEPTRGLDYRAKHQLGALLNELTAEGRGVVMSTHDVEFVAATAHRVIVIADGEIVADGDTATVIGSSPSFAPQVAKILAPRPWLTVDQLRVAGVLAGCSTPPAPTETTP
ncbi:MAG TPA: ATP-binding cassette domain-containing protein [Acidimicrobiia bacterium]|nr:ATP-binding cassette domain-containing protein [Acidimicrobiia bacterium]